MSQEGRARGKHKGGLLQQIKSTRGFIKIQVSLHRLREDREIHFPFPSLYMYISVLYTSSAHYISLLLFPNLSLNLFSLCVRKTANPVFCFVKADMVLAPEPFPMLTASGSAEGGRGKGGREIHPPSVPPTFFLVATRPMPRV